MQLPLGISFLLKKEGGNFLVTEKSSPIIIMMKEEKIIKVVEKLTGRKKEIGKLTTVWYLKH